ncbi:hypothetical protein D3C86_1641040 [compost metagenome]
MWCNKTVCNSPFISICKISVSTLLNLVVAVAIFILASVLVISTCCIVSKSISKLISSLSKLRLVNCLLFNFSKNLSEFSIGTVPSLDDWEFNFAVITLSS